jgi:hypothetical protein
MGGGGPEARRSTTPDFKLTDEQVQVEDARLQSRDAKACRAHFADLIRLVENHAGRPPKAVAVPVKVQRRS